MNLIRWLSIAGRHTKMYLDQQFAPLGINCSQHMYIIKICEHPGISQEQFLDLFYLHPSNITRGLGSLIKSGFITKNASQQDKRTYCLYPTPKAYAVYDKILAILRETQEQLLSPLSEEDAGKFGEMLQEIALQSVFMTQEK
ncbi:MarR family transcriptional regulator [Lachnospiraceae bacterium KGMB03038]|nr:MarR family transcriptional regulator [Lachnospiraceae bacterium KGMB03038]